jgi:hypothetical protein
MAAGVVAFGVITLEGGVSAKYVVAAGQVYEKGGFAAVGTFGGGWAAYRAAVARLRVVPAKRAPQVGRASRSRRSTSPRRARAPDPPPGRRPSSEAVA